MLGGWVWVAQETWKFREQLRTSECKGWMCLVTGLVGWCVCWFLLLVARLISFVDSLVSFAGWLVGWLFSFVGLFVCWLVG
jgi:putative Mn2+ efflux pump MntP